MNEAEFNRKTEINHRVQARYDALRRDGKHGVYECIFAVVHEELTRHTGHVPPTEQVANFKGRIRPDSWMDWTNLEDEQFGTVLRVSQSDSSLHLTKTTAAELREMLGQWLTYYAYVNYGG